MSRPGGHMAPITSRRMLDELWRLVLEELVEENPTQLTIAPLLLVCKAWKTCGQSLLYRHLCFSGIRQLRAFYEHLFFHATEGRYPGLYTQTFTLWTRGLVLQELSHYVPRMLGYLHNIRAFHAQELDICSSILEPLDVVAKRTLCELSLTLCSAEADGAINLAIVSRFTGLKKLQLRMNWGADSTVFAIGRAPGFRMPRLVSLALSSPRVPPVHEFLAFLPRCELPALTSLDLDFPHLTADGTASLQPVFEKLGSQLRHLSYNVPEAARLPQTALVLSPNLELIEFKTAAPSIDLIHILPATIQQINIPVDFSFSEGPAGVVRFLNDWLAENPADCSLRRVQLTMKGLQRFDWRTVGLVSPVFAGQLMTSAILLGARGVHIIDGFKNTLIMVAASQLTGLCS
ncbi:hypothetical protein DACRYDRAFT_119916 [Dacryopinax primogenitus]|uniref:F-box domain-containing protein n=1 Tax=Dacryopinax primogenitus (strain DJM 731) TaxID=1858805 RepID=M5FQ38_DACPD|nr:uncharacterized protein DACRYDRAFT_119916 [Dacryopinax primogenitus]EJT96699.1 hypothetical protein DACRYDRAFT_119916 [Dacryopinax primogenitus]